MQSSKNYIKTLNIVYFILLVTSILFLGLTIWFVKPERENEFYIEYIFTDFAVTILGIIITYYYPYKLLKKARLKIGFREKLYQYRKALFIRWILIFILVIYSTIGYILTHKYIFICTSLFCIIVLILGKINKKVICEHLELNSKERGIIYNPNAAI